MLRLLILGVAALVASWAVLMVSVARLPEEQLLGRRGRAAS